VTRVFLRHSFLSSSALQVWVLVGFVLLSNCGPSDDLPDSEPFTKINTQAVRTSKVSSWMKTALRALVLMDCRGWRCTLLDRRSHPRNPKPGSLQQRPGAFSALTQLSLRQNPMGLECASNIASWLRKCSDLRVVDLAATAIGPGAEFVIEGLVGCPTLSSLNLEDNRIGWETAARVRTPFHEQNSISMPS